MEKSSLSNIGSKIRRNRRVINLSQAELSKKLGISPSYLNLIENGRRSITVPLLIKLGNILEQSLKEIVEFGFSIKKFNDHSDLCLAGEDKEFVTKHMTYPGQ